MKAVSEVERFWSKVKKGGEDECWLWTGARVYYGYGNFAIKVGGKWGMTRAHRYSYQLAFGSPGKMFVCHRCDNPPCVNPNHLFLGTNFDNVRDKVQKGRHPNGERVYNAKLTEDTVKEIVRRVAAGETYRAIGQDLGVSERTVRNALTKRNWKHVVRPDLLNGKIRRREKITADKVREIRSAGKAGECTRKLAERFGLHRRHVQKIIANRMWSHVADE